jgi:hypothetical protein
VEPVTEAYVKRCDGVLEEPLRYTEYGAAVKDALGGSAYEVTSWGFWSLQTQYVWLEKCLSTYAVYRDAFPIQSDGDLSALPLLYAADTADASHMRVPVSRANRL